MRLAAVIRHLRCAGLRPFRATGRRRPRRRSGFTLLETMLAISLMTMLMAGLYSAMQIYFNLRADSQDEIERLQIARTLLRQMSRDIQSVVFEEQQTTDDSSGSSSSDTADSTGASDSSASADGEETGTTADTVTADPEASMTGYTNGLVGTETDLLLYVSRPDRDLDYVSSQELTSLTDRSGDLMIVRYFVAESGGGGLASEIAEREGSDSRDGAAGLVRMTGDLYGLSMAINENEEQDQMSAAQIQAREVTQLRFQYFDGAQWQTAWDSTQLNMLPLAVEITLTLRTLPPDDLPEDALDNDLYQLGETTHRMVVHLPLAKPYVAESAL